MFPLKPASQSEYLGIPAPLNNDFFSKVQTNINKGLFKEAIKELFFLLYDVSEIPDIQSVYAYLFQLFPHFDDKAFETLQSKYLTKLLSSSSNRPEESKRLVLMIGERALKSFTKTNPIASCNEAMNFFAKSIQIARQADQQC